MKGIFKKIGQVNAKLVPLNNSNSNTKAINTWLRKILFYKHGFPYLKPAWQLNNTNENLSPLPVMEKLIAVFHHLDSTGYGKISF